MTMRLKKLSMMALALEVTVSALAQTAPVQTFGLDKNQTPAWEIPLSYDLFRANAPAGQCGCFWMNGGGSGLVVNAKHGISLVADLTAVHTDKINKTGEALTIFDYQFGPRYSFRTHSRFTPYAQVLIGGSHLSSNYYGGGSNYFGSTVGGGVRLRVHRYLALTLGEADWALSKATNNNSDRQNSLRVTTGVVFLFGPR